MSVGTISTRVSKGFSNRHRFLTILLWAHVPVLAVVGPALGKSSYQVGLTSLTVMAFALTGTALISRRLAAVAIAAGLVAAAVMIVYLTDGVTYSHFAFLFAICAISLYRDWLILGLGVVGIAIFEFVAASATIADNDVSALAHAGAVTALALLLAAGWRLNPSGESTGETEDRFRMSFEEAPIGMAVLKPSGELLQANRSMAAMLGYERESLLGLNISALVHVDDQTELGEAWEMMGNSSEHVAAEWMRCLTAQGGAIWGRVSLSLVPRTPGQSAMVVFQLEDATNAYQERRELESLLKGKDEFVAAVGDEIRRPLDLLIDLTELADHPHADTRDTLPRIEAHARQIASIVDDLVVSARAGAAPIPVVARRLDAVALSREVVTRIPAADRVRLELNAGELWADPGLTRQILHNLIANALTYGGPDVTLRTAASGPDTVIQIIDNGPEVPEPERVFSGDLRSGRPVTKPAAVGLGLTVGRHLARLMEGDVEYRRTTGGENVFELRLPSEALSEIPKPRDHSQGLGLPV